MTVLPAWDLSDFYQGPQDPLIEKDLGLCSEKADAFIKAYKRQIKALSGADFAAAIKSYEEIEEILGKISIRHFRLAALPYFFVFLREICNAF